MIKHKGDNTAMSLTIASANSATAASSGFVSSINAGRDNTKMNRQDRQIWCLRCTFLTFVLVVAAVLGAAAYYMVYNSQVEMAETQYESIAERALNAMASMAARKQGGTVTMAAVVAQAVPNADDYPFVVVPGFEAIATRVLETSANRELGFLPLVEEALLPEFEQFAYKYYEERFPDNPKAGVSSFGKGVWSVDPTLPPDTDQRYHATSGSVKGSNETFLTPIFQHDKGAHPVLMLNVRADPARAKQIDDMLLCTRDRPSMETPCGAITDIVNLRGQPPGTGPGAVVLEPIYPVNNPDQMTAILATTIVWDEILEDVFADSVSGIDCVLETDERYGTVFSYTVQNGVAKAVGFGDNHSGKYNHYRRSITLNANKYTPQSPKYTIHLYPNDELYEVYQSFPPVVALLSAMAIMVLTSLLFLVYDMSVRKEFAAKKDLLEARRRFVRFISHEVRTPLNAVCIGLNLMQEKQAQKAGFERAEDLAKYIDDLEEGGGGIDEGKATTSAATLDSTASSSADEEVPSKSPLFSIPSNNTKSCTAEAPPQPSNGPLFSLEPIESNQANNEATSAKPLFSLEPPTESNQTSSNNATTSNKPLFSLEPPPESNQISSSNEGPPNKPLFSLEPTIESNQSSSSNEATSNKPLFSIAQPRECNQTSSGSEAPSSGPLFSIPPPKTVESLKDDKKPSSSNGALFAIAPPKAETTTPARTVDPEIVENFSLVQDLLQNAQSSVDVLSDFLNFDKIESGNLTLELSVVKLQTLVVDTANEFRLTATKKAINYDIVLDKSMQQPAVANQGDEEQALPDERAVIGDQVRLCQVLRNMISNSLKFTPKGNRVSVVVSFIPAVEQGNTRKRKQQQQEQQQREEFTLKRGETVSYMRSSQAVQIAVTDTGAGMTKAQLSQLFAEGKQFNPSDLQAGQGSGLGLFITKGIVEQHGGSIVATSDGLGRGCTFTVLLPLYLIPPPAEDTSSSEPPTPSNLGSSSAHRTDGNGNSYNEHFDSKPASQHILIVDDAASNRKMMRRLLEHHGHVCEVAEDGQVAVRMVSEAAARKEPFDTVLLDFEMPVMNGPTAAERIRANGFDTFIVGVTGNMFPEDIDTFMVSGANAVLPKPFRMDALDSLWAEYNQNTVDEFDPPQQLVSIFADEP